MKENLCSNESVVLAIAPTNCIPLSTYDIEMNVGFKYFPNVIPFGIQGADPTTLQQLIPPWASRGNIRLRELALMTRRFYNRS